MTQARIGAVFTANTAGLVAGTKTASSALDRLAADVRGVRSAMGTLNTLVGAQVFAQLGSFASSAARSLFQMGAAAAESSDKIRDLAIRTGTSYGEMAGLALAAEGAGVGADTLANAMTKADRAFIAAGQGSAAATKAFAGIGLSFQELQGLSPAERFSKISDAIAALPTAAERSAAAIALFGRAGAQLVPLFNEGSGAVSEATAQAERFGLALTGAQADNIDALGDSFTTLNAAIRGVVTQVVAELSTVGKALNDALSNYIGTQGGANIGQAIADAILNAGAYLADLADYIVASIPEVFRFAEGVAVVWRTAADIFGRVFQFGLGVFKVFEQIGNVIGGLFSDIVAALYGAAARIAEVVPGFGEFADGLRQSAGEWNAQARQYARAMNQNSDEAGQAFGRAFGTETAAAAGQVAGPIRAIFDDARRKAEEARRAGEKPGQQSPQVALAPLDTRIVKGLDIRSSAGVAELLRLSQPDGASKSKEQRALDAQERAADGIEDLVDASDEDGVADFF